MAGVDTVRGIAYQQVQAVLAALDVLAGDLASIRVEGTDDVVDIELLATSGSVVHAKQIKTRRSEYTWAQADLVKVLRRWAALPDATSATFEFLTDGRLGPSGENVRIALIAASRHDFEPLQHIMGPTSTDASLCLLGHARVRLDTSTNGELLLRAQREVASMLPSPRTPQDAAAAAETSVNRLYHLLFDHAAMPCAQDRLVTRQEIASCLGVAHDQPTALRWPGTLRDRFLESCSHPPHDLSPPGLCIGMGAVQPQITAVLEPDRELDPILLGDGRRGKVVAGTTGSGKTTTAYSFQRASAAAGLAVVIASAEAYIPGRLAALAADALGLVLNEAIPTATGRQVLSDTEVTLVIDGVSEIPEVIREALTSEIQPLATSERGAKVILLGRDLAVLRGVFPASVQPIAYLVAKLSRPKRRELVKQWLTRAGSSDRADHVQARLERLLGEASENPLLFTMGLHYAATDTTINTRSDLYTTTIEQLAVRTGATDVALVSRVLGHVFAAQLNNERRYADPSQWHQQLERAIESINDRSGGITADRVNRSAHRSGLVARTGNLQLITPIHDSFADFLAGSAHAAGLPLPSRLRSGDDQRIQFACEMGGVTDELATLVSRDLPFIAPRIAPSDAQELGEHSPKVIERLLGLLLNEEDRVGVALCRLADGRLLAATHVGASSWMSQESLFAASESSGQVVLSSGGPIAVAVRLWRITLQSILHEKKGGLGAPRPTTLAEAVQAIRAHTHATRLETEQLLLRIAPPGHEGYIKGLLAPLNAAVLVYPEEDAFGIPAWPVRFMSSSDSDPTVAAFESAPDIATETDSWGSTDRWGSTTVEAIISKTPASTAAENLRTCMNDAVGDRWLK